MTLLPPKCRRRACDVAGAADGVSPEKLQAAMRECQWRFSLQLETRPAMTGSHWQMSPGNCAARGREQNEYLIIDGCPVALTLRRFNSSGIGPRAPDS